MIREVGFSSRPKSSECGSVAISVNFSHGIVSFAISLISQYRRTRNDLFAYLDESVSNQITYGGGGGGTKGKKPSFEMTHLALSDSRSSPVDEWIRL